MEKVLSIIVLTLSLALSAHIGCYASSEQNELEQQLEIDVFNAENLDRMPLRQSPLTARLHKGCTLASVDTNIALSRIKCLKGSTNINRLVMSPSVTRVEEGCCSGLTRLERMTLSKNLTGISKLAFHNCYSLKSAILPHKLAYIGSGAFHNCCALESVYVPRAVKKIEFAVFRNCSSLKSLTFHVCKDSFLVTSESYGFLADIPKDCKIKIIGTDNDLEIIKNRIEKHYAEFSENVEYVNE